MRMESSNHEAMISLKQARRSDRLMRVTTSLTVTEFEALARQFGPVLGRAAGRADGRGHHNGIGRKCGLGRSGFIHSGRAQWGSNESLGRTTPTIQLDASHTNVSLKLLQR